MDIEAEILNSFEKLNDFEKEILLKGNGEILKEKFANKLKNRFPELKPTDIPDSLSNFIKKYNASDEMSCGYKDSPGHDKTCDYSRT